MTTLLAGILFAVLSYISQLVLPGTHFANTDAAATEVMLKAGGQFLANFFTAAYVAGSLGAALASQAAVSRIIYSMGRDRLLPTQWFGSLSPRYGTPVKPIILVSLVSLLAVVFDLETLASLISFGALVAFSAVNLAVIRTHLFGEQPQRDAKALLQHGLVPLIGMGLTLWLWTSLSGLTLVIGLCWFAVGLAYLMALTSGFRRPVPKVDFSEAG